MNRGGQLITRREMAPALTCSRYSQIKSRCQFHSIFLRSRIGHAWRTNSTRLRLASVLSINCSWLRLVILYPPVCQVAAPRAPPPSRFRSHPTRLALWPRAADNRAVLRALGGRGQRAPARRRPPAVGRARRGGGPALPRLPAPCYPSFP